MGANETAVLAVPAQQQNIVAGFFDVQSFELLQRISKAFASSDLVPKSFKDNLPNCMLAMDMSQRIGANPLMVMQNLDVIQGKPGWSSKFLIATINSCGRYHSLSYERVGDDPKAKNYKVRAYTTERATGKELFGEWITWDMVSAEGWDNKAGSKWKTMPGQMFLYRAASFWQRVYAPEIGMGLSTVEELQDIVDVDDEGRVTVTKGRAGKSRVVDPETGEITNSMRPVIPFCTVESFDSQKDGWKALVESGKKSANALIAMIQTAETLSDDQKIEIASWESITA